MHHFKARIDTPEANACIPCSTQPLAPEPCLPTQKRHTGKHGSTSRCYSPPKSRFDASMLDFGDEPLCIQSRNFNHFCLFAIKSQPDLHCNHVSFCYPIVEECACW